MRQRIDVVELKSIPNGYEFRLGPHDYRLRFDDGAWRLSLKGWTDNSSLFESFNEALNFALEERFATPCDQQP
jgi:hypothetical protein